MHILKGFSAAARHLRATASMKFTAFILDHRIFRWFWNIFVGTSLSFALVILFVDAVQRDSVGANSLTRRLFFVPAMLAVGVVLMSFVFSAPRRAIRWWVGLVVLLAAPILFVVVARFASIRRMHEHCLREHDDVCYGIAQYARLNRAANYMDYRKYLSLVCVQRVSGISRSERDGDSECRGNHKYILGPAGVP